MVKRGADDMAPSSEVFVDADAACQGVYGYPNSEEPSTTGKESEDSRSRFPSCTPESQHFKKNAAQSPASTAASTPEMAPTTSPEARARAQASNLGTLPVRDLKARLKALGADISGLTEKTELVVLLEQLEFMHCPEKVPPFVL
eukprot:TRINITY_DN842_c0_g2_i1.p1 TRINITY_DN842_c0_g2~~TRINITY_DN842_c0_g2_i1.p1  ORF type:complete len:144 (+),score=29.66 TRINITY_DN842_c0_g2_i1:78-509(+)